jgi:hypothetical protein
MERTMFLSTEIVEASDDDREDLGFETAEPPPRLPAHLELVSVDSGFSASTEVIDLDPPTPLLPYTPC